MGQVNALLAGDLVLTRRQFLVAAGQVATIAGVSACTLAAAQPGSVLRPPGSCSEEHLLATCLRCQKCQEACPTGVVVAALVTDGLVNVRTPKLIFRHGYCDLCARCVQVCPTGALAPFDRNTVRLGIARIDETKCVAWQYMGCSECLDYCPARAITLDGARRPVVDANLCNGCGRCEYVCIAAMVRAYGQGGGRGITVVSGDAA